MHLSDNNLGFEPTSAIFTALALKDALGIGKKKRARDRNVAETTGYYTSQFPSGTSFDWFLDNSPARSELGIRDGAANLRDDYAKMFAHKDSWLVKNSVGSAEDYGAYQILQDIKRDGGCDPNEKRTGYRGYKWCPRDRESGINIYDKARLKEYYDNKGASKTTSSVPIAAPATVKQPFIDRFRAQSEPQIQPLFSQQSNPFTSLFAQRSPAPTTSQADGLSVWVIPTILAVGAGAFILMRKKKGRR